MSSTFGSIPEKTGLMKSEIASHIAGLDREFPTEAGCWKQYAPRTHMDYESEIASIRTRRDDSRFDVTPEEMERLANGSLSWMLDHNRRKVVSEMASCRQERFDWRYKKSDREELAALMKRAWDDDKQVGAARELANYRQFVVFSDLLAMPFALSAFQSINLSADELPQIITPKKRQFFNVWSMGQDGGARQDGWKTTRSATELPINMISTDKVEYPLWDLQQGDVVELDKINAQLRYDMEMKIDVMAQAVLDANVSTTGIKSLLNIGPYIDQTNIPDGNFLDLTNVSYGTPGSMSITKLKAILGQLAQWGYGLDPDGPIRIASMIMSPQNARDSWDYVSLVSAQSSPAAGIEVDPKHTITPAQREGIYAGGAMMNSAWGYTWENQYNTRIAKGTLYVTTNQPVGWYFQKTDFDKTIEWRDTPDAMEMNQGQIMMRKALNFFMPNIWRYRYLKVIF